MKDRLIEIVTSGSADERRNLAREYLQVYILRLVHEAGAMRHLAFVGGTALRLIHALPRFSEDLDFSLSPGKGTVPEPGKLFGRIAAVLEKSGYEVTMKARTRSNVANVFFRFHRVPFELGWSDDPRARFPVKLEIDLDPPGGFVVETSLVQRFYPVALRHHDLPSLFAGKLHALLARPYAKGRDWFDLAWYLTEKRGLAPNVAFLANALAQTGHGDVDASRWRMAVRERLGEVRWNDMIEELGPFVERRGDLDHLSPELIDKLLG
jgi:predicted nucleotidyltransferase component of viral defense system